MQIILILLSTLFLTGCHTIKYSCTDYNINITSSSNCQSYTRVLKKQLGIYRIYHNPNSTCHILIHLNETDSQSLFSKLRTSGDYNLHENILKADVTLNKDKNNIHHINSYSSSVSQDSISSHDSKLDLIGDIAAQISLLLDRS